MSHETQKCGLTIVIRRNSLPKQAVRHKPPVAWQDRIAQIQVKADILKRLHTQTQTELDALLSSILDKTFKGEL